MANAMFHATKKTGGLLQLKSYLGVLVNTGAMSRAWGSKPMWAQLKITERCNLNCGYCTEHRNEGNHVPAETVEAWMEQCRKLGVKHIEFIGGEPLMHPNLFQFLAKARELKMNTGLTTNGFLMDAGHAEKLLACGISRLQLSIDCVEPNAVTRKAFSLLRPQLQLLRGMGIWVHVNSVLTKETLPQAYDLARELFSLDIPVAFMPAHDQGRLSAGPEDAAIMAFYGWLKGKKAEGYPVNMPLFLIDYFMDKVSGKKVPWRCEGGCKAFYVDNEGGFRICSHTPSSTRLEEVDAKTLRDNHNCKKGCEEDCGVACMIVSSFPFTRRGYILRSHFLPRFGSTRKGAGRSGMCNEPKNSRTE